jgi:hypothetical protein
MSAESALKPASTWAVVVPSDTLDIVPSPRSLYVTATGNAALVGDDDVVVTVPVVAGSTLPFRPKRVNATGTDASLVAIW